MTVHSKISNLTVSAGVHEDVTPVKTRDRFPAAWLSAASSSRHYRRNDARPPNPGTN